MLYSEWKELMHLSVEDNGKGNDIAKRREDLSAIFNSVIDDTESVDDWRIPQIDNQLIMLKHTQDKELVIENMEA